MVTEIVDLDLGSNSSFKILTMEGDICSRFIEFHLSYNGEVFNLQNKSVKCRYVNDKTTEEVNLVINDRVNGVCTLEIPYRVTSTTQNGKCELVISQSGEILSTMPFSVEVANSLVERSTVESSSEFGALNDALWKVDGFDNRLNNINSQLGHKASKDEVNVERKRIDLLTKIDGGQTEGNAELLDIRIGANGNTYETSGQSVRGQVNWLNSKITNDKNIINSIIKNDEIIEDNIFEFEQFGYGNQDGYIVENNDPLVENTRIRGKGTKINYEGLEITITSDSTHSFWLTIAELDSNGYKIVGETSVWSKTYTFTVNSNYYYFIAVKEDSGITVNKDYAYNYLKISIKREKEKVIGREELKLTFKDGYISSSGSLVSGTSGGAIYSNSFLVKKGEILTIKAKGYLTNVSILSENKIIDKSYPVLIKSVDGVTSYTYIATEDKNVIVSGLKSYGISVIRQYSIDDEIKNINSEMEYLKDYNYLMMFKKIGGVGDSLMSGEHAYSDGSGEHYIDRYDYSWLSYLTKNSYSEKVHYSKGGLSTKSWLSSEYKTNLENETPKCKAYFVGLGTNDMNLKQYPVGTISDVAGTNSFVGYYKQIIEFIHSVAPNSKIFMISLYELTDNAITYSNMIKAISELYDYCYYIDLINNSDVLIKRDGQFVSWGHFNTLGYIKLAKNIERITNGVIIENISDFAMFGLNN